MRTEENGVEWLDLSFKAPMTRTSFLRFLFSRYRYIDCFFSPWILFRKAKQKIINFPPLPFPPHGSSNPLIARKYLRNVFLEENRGGGKSR